MEPDVIDRYLAELARSLPRDRALRDVLAEVEDHLRESVDRLSSQGVETGTAQRITLDRFGDLAVVARAYATNAGGLAIPTSLTRAAGIVGFPTAALWLLTGLSAVVSSWIDPDDGTWIYPGVTVLATLSVIATTVVVTGMLVRSGGVRNGPALCCLGLMVLAILGTAAAPWAWVFTAAPLTAAVVIAVRRTRWVEPPGPRWDRPLMLAWPVGAVVGLLGDAMSVGPVDSYGDYPWALLAGFNVAVVLFVAGLVGLGTWLSQEQAQVMPGSRHGGAMTFASDAP